MEEGVELIAGTVDRPNWRSETSLLGLETLKARVKH